MNNERQKAVVMACDANYAPYTFCLAEQIAQAHPHRDFDICIFSAQPLEVPKSLAQLDLKCEVFAGVNPFEGGPNASRHGSATYLRLLIPGLLANRYRRILHLDGDILYQGQGIDILLAADLCGATLGAVRDNTQWRTPGRSNPEFQVLGRSGRPYFNAGVLLIDTKRYVEQDVLGKCLELWGGDPGALIRHDQSLLNLVVDGTWAEFSPVWNWQYTWSSRFFADLAEPRLIHFIGPRKPWKDTSAALPARFRRTYHAFVARHYPDQPELAPVDPVGLGWPTRSTRTFLKHLLSDRAMRRYLTRFPDADKAVALGDTKG